MSAHASDSENHGHGEHGDGQHFAHPMPVPMLLGIFFTLVILTIITVVQAGFDLGSFDVVVVMVIATIKAALVAFFFMHLAYDKPFNVIVFFSSFVFVALFIIFTLSDKKLTDGDTVYKQDDVVPAVAEAAEP
ncbi:MAG: cytochrome C oxidase subunit IV family protein, partial [Planctomycetota bacterium]